MFNNYLLSKNKFFIYTNYSLAFAGSLLFLIYAKEIGLSNLKQYILVISLSSIFVFMFCIKVKIVNVDGRF